MKAITTLLVLMAISSVSMAGRATFKEVRIPLKVGANIFVINAVLRDDNTIMATPDTDGVNRIPLVAESADGRVSASLSADNQDLSEVLCNQLGLGSTYDRVINTRDRLSRKLAKNNISYDPTTRTFSISEDGGYYLSMLQCR